MHCVQNMRCNMTFMIRLIVAHAKILIYEFFFFFFCKARDNSHLLTPNARYSAFGPRDIFVLKGETQPENWKIPDGRKREKKMTNETCILSLKTIGMHFGTKEKKNTKEKNKTTPHQKKQKQKKAPPPKKKQKQKQNAPSLPNPLLVPVYQ